MEDNEDRLGRYASERRVPETASALVVDQIGEQIEYLIISPEGVTEEDFNTMDVPLSTKLVAYAMEQITNQASGERSDQWSQDFSERMRGFLDYFEPKLGTPRVIYSRDGYTPYLSRYYLSRKPTMSDGTYPFDECGRPREGIVWPDENLSVYLHRFHMSDDDGALHNHPWGWSASIILAGGYYEDRRQEDDTVTRTKMLPGSVNLIQNETYHRVDLIEEDCWSLFFTGPKDSSWGFWDPNTGKFQNWKDYIREKRSK